MKSAKNEVKSFIEAQNNLDTLKFITCGSVDDGKSTLLGRLLYESQLIFEDQVESLIKDSKKIGTQGEDIDFALLVDGLAAEREQGITIDVAYRFFSTEKRKFIVADSPGHEQYTRNMVTAASSAELAIILIDARKGVLEQTKRHSYIANMMGIENIVVAINKMDLIDYSEEEFKNIVEDYEQNISSFLDFKSVKYVPISALRGENIVKKSNKTAWYKGHPIMKILESEQIADNPNNFFCMHIQNVLRPNLDFRGFCGNVASGNLCKGDRVFISNSGKSALINDIYIGDKDVEECKVNDAVTLTLDQEIDISRGDILCSSPENLLKGKILNAKLIWMDNSRGIINRFFLLKIGSKVVNARILKIKNKIDINTYSNVSSSFIEMNDIVECEILVDEEISFKDYKTLKDLGSFILISKESNLTLAGGVINFEPRKSQNVVWENLVIDNEMRENLMEQRGMVVWFTGLSGSGKSTISNLLEIELHKMGLLTYLLDGDNLRHGLNRDLGFVEADRIENIRRVGEIVKLFSDSAIFTLATFISPFENDRNQIREKISKGKFVEVYVKVSNETAIERDPKGLYKKALNGEIPNFTGINSPYEEPKHPEIIIDTENQTPEESVKIILDYLEKNKCLKNLN